MELLEIRNPHSILAALNFRPKDIVELKVPAFALKTGDSSDAWTQIAECARQNNVRVAAGSGGAKERSEPRVNHDGRQSAGMAKMRPAASVSLEAMIRLSEVKAQTKKGSAFATFLILDQLQDPHNVGAIFRAAAFFGVTGIFLTADRSTSLTATVYDVASGGVESVPFCEVTNLKMAVEKLKEKSIWILGSSEHAKQSYRAVKSDRHWAIVLGNEENGMRRLTQDSCDDLVTIPAAKAAGVTSLNVAVANGILLAHFLNG